MFNYRTGILLLSILALTAVSGLGQSRTLPSGEWTLVELNGRRIINSKAFINIETASGRVTGNAGCNRMFGAVSGGRRGKISFSDIGTTKMYCADADARRIETQFLNALARVAQYREDRRELSLYDRNRVVLRFRKGRQVPPEEPAASKLEGVKWMLESIGGKKVSGAGAAAFIRFDAAKGSVGGDTSCNVFGGSYTTNGQRLTVGEVIATMRACIEDDRMTIERQLLDALETTNRYAVSGNRLTLFRNQRALLTFRGTAASDK